MYKKNKFIIAASILSLAAVGGITIGATTAIFTKGATANIHVTSGSLDVKFFLTDLAYDKVVDGQIKNTQIDLEKEYGSSGAYVNKFGGEDISGIDLTKYEGPFNIQNIYPSFKGSATFVVKNCNDMEITLDLQTTKKAENSKGETLDDSVFTLTNDNDPTSKLAVNGTRYINVYFTLDKDADNDYQSSIFDFDVMLTAKQALVRE